MKLQRKVGRTKKVGERKGKERGRKVEELQQEGKQGRIVHRDAPNYLSEREVENRTKL